jgi:PEP-CTERM motif
MMNTNRWLAALAIAVSSACLGSAANADMIPYPDAGTPITVPSYNFTATATGNIIAYFFASDAGDTEEVSMLVNGVPTGIFGLNNQSSTVGQAFNLGSVSVGDTIEFFIRDFTTGVDWFSNAAANSDGFNHAYATSYSGTVLGIPVGTYVGFEDRGAGGDYDYNDDQFVFTNVTSGVPEASTWVMLLAGFGGLGFAALRRSHKAKSSIA